jgi:hypothetical protein
VDRLKCGKARPINRAVMTLTRSSLALLPAAAVALVAPAAASARFAPVTGTLPKPGYTVVALGYDGTSVSSHARSFKLVPRAARVTLQLRDAHGKYAGPVVVGVRHGKAVLGVKAGARLGRIKLLAGFARTAKPLAARFADAKRTTAHGVVPAGNGRNFGLVRSTGHGASGPGGDTDGDGVPNAFDIDADGDLVLNPLERGASPRQAPVDPKAGPTATPPASGAPPAPGGPSAPGFQSLQNFSQLFLELDQTVNADAAAVTQADIDAAVERFLEVVFIGVPANTTLDCGGLTWCSPGGTGYANGDPRIGPPGDPFPGASSVMPLSDRGEFRLLPHASTAQIGSGDTVIGHTSDGRELTSSLAFVFSTVPAISRWSDGAGDGATLSYPVAAGTPGTRNNPLEIAPSPNGDYELTFTFWRPQRRAIATAGEGDGFIDVGGLAYAADVVNFGPSSKLTGMPQCPSASLSTADPSLAPTAASQGQAGDSLTDTAPDRPADPANQLTFTVDLSRCGQLRGQTLAPGTQFILDLGAFPTNPQVHDHANQTVYVRTR